MTPEKFKLVCEIEARIGDTEFSIEHWKKFELPALARDAGYSRRYGRGDCIALPWDGCTKQDLEKLRAAAVDRLEAELAKLRAEFLAL